jgi:trans-aconitate methyltransferase
MDLKEEQAIGEAVEQHWYYRSKSAAMLRLVAQHQPRKILDVGAGSGFFSKYLLRHTEAGSAWCIDPFYPQEQDDSLANKPIRYRHECTGTDADLVLMMDVLEHVEDDLALLNEYVAKVPAGTRFLVTVPAFQFLWSGHDVFLEHYRRYTLAEVTDLMERAGLVVEQRAYYFGLVFPLAVAVRLLGRLRGRNINEAKSDLKQHSALTNGLLSLLCRAELPFFRFNRIAGLSVFCLAQKS